MQIIFLWIGGELPVVLLVSVSGIIFSFCLYMARWVRQRRIMAKAENWIRVDATVVNCFELDENTGLDSPNLINMYLQGERAEYVARYISAIEYTYNANGEVYSGTDFLPQTSLDGYIAAEAGQRWLGRNIIVRFDPEKPEASVFLEQDGAPGRSYIPRTISKSPYMTTLPFAEPHETLRDK